MSLNDLFKFKCWFSTINFLPIEMSLAFGSLWLTLGYPGAIYDGAIYNTRGHQRWPLLRPVFEGHSGLMYNCHLSIMYGLALHFAFVLSADARYFGIARVCLMCSVLLPSSVFFFWPWPILLNPLLIHSLLLSCVSGWCLFLLPLCKLNVNVIKWPFWHCLQHILCSSKPPSVQVKCKCH